MQEKQANPVDNVKNVFTWVILALYAAGKPVRVFTRRPGTCGLWYFGYYLWAGWIITIFGAQILSPDTPCDPRVLGWICWGGLIAQAVHFWSTVWARTRGVVLHSYDSGLPIILPKNPRHFVFYVFAQDIGASFLIAALCFAFNAAPLGMWFIVLPFPMLLSELLIGVRDSLRVQAMDDGMREQQRVMRHTTGRYDNL